MAYRATLARWVGRSTNTAEAATGGRRHFWQMPGACGLRPSARTHHKKGLVLHLPVGWGMEQIPQNGSGRVCLGSWIISFGLRGPSPRLLLPSGRLGSSPGAWGATNKGNADGAVGIFEKCRARVGYGPVPGPTKKKALCHTCPLGGAWNKYHRICNKRLACLRVRWTKDTLLRDFWIHLLAFISPSYLFIDLK